MRLQSGDSSSALVRYLTDIRGGTLLTREEEADLARSARIGNRDAMNRLVVANLGFVVKVAGEYRHCGLPFEDLLAEGNLGLLEAARRFDVTRGTKFITFAVWWIRKSILTALAKGVGLVRIPDHQRRNLRRIRRAEESLVSELGRPPEREELARSLVLSAARLERELLLGSRTRSLDEPASRKGDVPLSEALPDTEATSGERDLLRREAIELVTRALECLDPQERCVLEYRYGLNKERSLVLREVGRRMGVSRERVRQIEVKALRRLRRTLAPRVRAGAFAVVGGPPVPPPIRTPRAGARIALETRSSPG